MNSPESYRFASGDVIQSLGQAFSKACGIPKGRALWSLSAESETPQRSIRGRFGANASKAVKGKYPVGLLSPFKIASAKRIPYSS